MCCSSLLGKGGRGGQKKKKEVEKLNYDVEYDGTMEARVTG